MKTVEKMYSFNSVLNETKQTVCKKIKNCTQTFLQRRQVLNPESQGSSLQLKPLVRYSKY
jgi:hypothetical protein